MVFILFGYLLYKMDVFISKYWARTTGHVTDFKVVTIENINSRRRTTKVTIRYSLGGKTYQFTHEGSDSRDPWKIDKRVNLQYDKSNFKKVQVASNPKGVAMIMALVGLPGFAMSWLTWKPTSLSQLAEVNPYFAGAVAIALTMVFLNSNIKIQILALFQSISHQVDFLPENAEEIP